MRRRLRHLLCLVVAVAAIAVPAALEAATQNLYYLSARYKVANHEDVASRPTFTAGYVRLDRSALPKGNALKDHTVTGEFDWFSDTPGMAYSPGLVGFDFAINGKSHAGDPLFAAPDFTMTFRRNGMPKSWSAFETSPARPISHAIDGGPGHGSDATWNYFYSEDGSVTSQTFRRDYLLGLGYREGSKPYNRHYGNDLLWEAVHGTDQKGRWFRDAAAFEAALERRIAQGERNPPKSYLDIPARNGGQVSLAQTPLPPSALLLLAGIAGMAVWRRKAA